MVTPDIILPIPLHASVTPITDLKPIPEHLVYQIERTNVEFTKIYPSESTVSQVVPVVEELLLEDLTKNNETKNYFSHRGCKHVPVHITNRLGFYIGTLSLQVYEFDNNQRVWVVERLTEHSNEHSLSVAGDSLQKAWVIFKNHFEKIKRCEQCGRTSTNGDKPCLSCLIRKDIIHPINCDICMTDKIDHYRLLCGHSYCRPCLKRTKPHKCPTCRVIYHINRGFKEYSRHNHDGNDDSDEDNNNDDDEIDYEFDYDSDDSN